MGLGLGLGVGGRRLGRLEALQQGRVQIATLAGLAWVLPDRPLTPEIERGLRVHYLRGADLWHVAAALFLADDPAAVDVLTLDEDQAAAAEALGFGRPRLEHPGAGR